ncbi:hypothetical protein HUU53_01075 [Candidatus Micrarchaeota archaeon]|nr:hypothetical protein [Candidatus Micrarchaeota archaeon]
MKNASLLVSDKIVLVLVPRSKYLEANVDLVKQLLSKNDAGVFVTTNKPFSYFEELFSSKKINSENLFFIDCVSSLVKGSSTRDENALFVSPKNLTGISIAINEAINGITGSKFVFFDSVTTLLIYNNSSSMEKFVHFLINRFRINGVTSIFLSLEDDSNPSLISAISRFSDKVITL